MIISNQNSHRLHLYLGFVILVSSIIIIFLVGSNRPRLEIVTVEYVTTGLFGKHEPFPRQALKYTNKWNRSSIIYEMPITNAESSILFAHPTFSPKYDYIATNYSGYEVTLPPSIFRVSDKTNILNGDYNFDVNQDLIWDPNERFFVFNSFHEDFGGTGRSGLFFSFYPFDNISAIKEFSLNQAFAGSTITDVYLNGNQIFFTSIQSDPQCRVISAQSDCPLSPPQKYVFDTNAQGLQLLAK